jgi:predicted nucleic acid-binding Zn ribbon protein
MRPPGGSRPARVGDVLRERIAALGWDRRLREEDVVTGWEDAVGPQIAAHARPSHVVNRRLTVVTENPVWTQQLALLKPELLRRIAARFGPEAVTDLFFITGRLDPRPVPQAPATEPSRPATLPPELAGELAAIGDGGVRESVRRLILAALAAGGPAA